jgi:predicted transcriptional regulator of viral defense system
MVAPRKVIADLARAASGALITVQEAAKVLGVSSHDAAVHLARLARGGWLARARRGLYLVLPIEAIPGSASVVDDAWVLAAQLFAPCYIGGWTAAEHWGLTEQLFRSTFVASAAAQRERSVNRLSTEFHIVRVKPDRMNGTMLVWRGSQRVAVSDRERTLIDALIHPAWVGGVRHLAEIFVTYRDSKEFDPAKLLSVAQERATGASFKRLGYLAERLWPDQGKILELAYSQKTTGVIKLDPSIARRGKMSKRWGLWCNVNIEGAW